MMMDEYPVINRIACELVFMIGPHTVSGQHSQSTPALLGQGCMHV